MGKNDLTLIFILNTIFDIFSAPLFLSYAGITFSQIMLTIFDVMYHEGIKECVNEDIIRLYTVTIIISFVIVTIFIPTIVIVLNDPQENSSKGQIGLIVLYFVKIMIIIVMYILLKLENNGDCDIKHYDYLKIRLNIERLLPSAAMASMLLVWCFSVICNKLLSNTIKNNDKFRYQDIVD